MAGKAQGWWLNVFLSLQCIRPYIRRYVRIKKNLMVLTSLEAKGSALACTGYNLLEDVWSYQGGGFVYDSFVAPIMCTSVHIIWICLTTSETSLYYTYVHVHCSYNMSDFLLWWLHHIRTYMYIWRNRWCNLLLPPAKSIHDRNNQNVHRKTPTLFLSTCWPTNMPCYTKGSSRRMSMCINGIERHAH